MRDEGGKQSVALGDEGEVMTGVEHHCGGDVYTLRSLLTPEPLDPKLQLLKRNKKSNFIYELLTGFVMLTFHKM